MFSVPLFSVPLLYIFIVTQTGVCGYSILVISFFLSFRYPEFTTEKIIHGFRGDVVRGALQIGILHPASHFFGWNNGMQRSYTIKHCAQSTLMKRLHSFKELKLLFTKSLKLISLLCSFAVHLSNIVGLTKH